MKTATEKYCRDCAFAILIILLSIAPLAVGARQEPSGDLWARWTASRTAQDRLKTKITYSCVDKPIETVLMELADLGQIDIVKSPKVTGNVTAKVTGVPLGEALTNILAAHDYTYIATENMVRVVPISEIIRETREPRVTKIYRITYADANELALGLISFLGPNSPDYRVGINRGTSHIIVTAPEDKIKAVDEFIEQVDIVTPQVLVEVRIYDITTKEGFELSPEWYAGRSGPLTTIDRMRSSISSTGLRSPTGTTTTVTDQDITRRSVTGRRKPFVGGSYDRIEGGTLSFGLLNDAVDIDLALSILHEQLEAKLLANPRILVLDNETANFDIVREIPYRELRQVAREDPITYTAFKNVGVHLEVTPHVTRGEMIRLRITPEFSILVSQDAAGVPTVDTRRADTTALVEDGQTIAIGGLRKRESTKDVTKVPVLGDIPLLGGLFTSETEAIQTNELVVFITTRIVTKAVLSEIEKMQLEETEFSGVELTRTRGTEPDVSDTLDTLLRKLESYHR
jgi:type IV pilus assembly protein PilQ